MIRVTLTNEILKRISEIDENRFSLSTIDLPPVTKNRLKKTPRKKAPIRAVNMTKRTILSEKFEDNKAAAEWGIRQAELIKKSEDITRRLVEKYIPIILSRRKEQLAARIKIFI